MYIMKILNLVYLHLLVITKPRKIAFRKWNYGIFHSFFRCLGIIFPWLIEFHLMELYGNQNSVKLKHNYFLYILRIFFLCTKETDLAFGVCNYLHPCRQCQIDDELMKQRQLFEKNEFLRLSEKTRLTQMFQSSTSPVKAQQQLYAISTVWFKQWEQFVQFKHCPQKHQIPGPISNYSICNQQLLKNKVFQLNKSNFQK